MIALRWRVLAFVGAAFWNGWCLWYLPMWVTIPFLVLSMSVGILATRLAVPTKTPFVLPLVGDAWHQRFAMARQAHESHAYAAQLASDPEAYAVWNEGRFLNEASADLVCALPAPSCPRCGSKYKRYQEAIAKQCDLCEESTAGVPPGVQ
jgi:hypothetical protein